MNKIIYRFYIQARNLYFMFSNIMKKVIILVALFAALGTTNTQAQYRQEQTVWGSNEYDNNVYTDGRGDYRWEMRERRVWIPEYRTTGIFGIGSRRIPGHYEMRRERIKVYLGQNRQNGQYGKQHPQHPHGMPPGQRKKMGNGGYEGRRDDDRQYDDRRYDDRRSDDRRYDDRRDNDRRYDDRDQRYETKGKGKHGG